MKVLLIAALILAPLPALADHMDVIQIKLKEKCSVQEYVAIARDFNEQWGKSNGYHAEIAVPVQNDDLVSIYWLGRSSSAAAFGKAWDTWRDELPNAKSVAAKLQARFTKCSENVSRSGYDIY